MDDAKRILFSDAGGTGRNYHADLSARNQRLRVHYLLGTRLEGRRRHSGPPARTNQAQPPLFRPIATDVKGGSALPLDHRRSSTRWAPSRGPAPDRRQGPVPAEDNLKSPMPATCAAPALSALVRGKVEGCSLDRFRVRHRPEADGFDRHRTELPPITTFLNRLLASPSSFKASCSPRSSNC